MQEYAQKLLETLGGTWASIGSVLIVCFVLSKIEVAKIPVNPWGFLRKRVGDFFGQEYSGRLSALEKENAELKAMLAAHIERTEAREADKARRRILAFDSELRRSKKHTDGEFEDALETIRQYEGYCGANPDYKNHVAGAAIEHVKSGYQRRLERKQKGTDS